MFINNGINIQTDRSPCRNIVFFFLSARFCDRDFIYRFSILNIIIMCGYMFIELWLMILHTRLQVYAQRLLGSS